MKPPEPVCTCGHLQLVHENDHSWCWVSTCECAQSSIRHDGNVGKKRLKEATCKHPHCGEPIYYSDFTGTWLHWSNAGEACPNNTVAEPLEGANQMNVISQPPLHKVRLRSRLRQAWHEIRCREHRRPLKIWALRLIGHPDGY